MFRNFIASAVTAVLLLSSVGLSAPTGSSVSSASSDTTSAVEGILGNVQMKLGPLVDGITCESNLSLLLIVPLVFVSDSLAVASNNPGDVTSGLSSILGLLNGASGDLGGLPTGSASDPSGQVGDLLGGIVSVRFAPTRLHDDILTLLCNMQSLQNALQGVDSSVVPEAQGLVTQLK